MKRIQNRDNLIKQAALMFARGKSYSQIAKQLSVSSSTVKYWATSCKEIWDAAYYEAVSLIGEVRHRRWQKPSAKTIEEAARMQAKGVSLENIAAHFGVTSVTVEHWKARNRETWDSCYLSELQPFEATPTAPPMRPTDPTKPARTLRSLCELLFSKKATIRSQQTRRHYFYSINDLHKYLGHVPTEADLLDDVLSGWMVSLMQQTERDDKPRTVETARSKLFCVRALWRFLNDRGEVHTRPTFSLPVAPDPVPIALDEDELRRLFESALCRPGFVCGIPARYWWTAFLGFVFCTSERLGATLSLRWEWTEMQSKAVSIPAQFRKGSRKPAVYRLWDEVIFLLRRIQSPRRELVFPWDMSQTSYFNHFGRILIDAQLPNDRRHKTHSLRVTHNTWTKVMTGQHSPLLMHSDTTTSERHYEDRRFTAREPVKLSIPWSVPVKALAQ